MGSLRGTAWGSRIFFHQLYPCWVLQPEVVGTYLPGTGTLGWEAWCGAGLLIPKIPLPNFYPPHVDEGLAHSTSLPLLSVWMDVFSLIQYLSDFHLISFLMVLCDGCSIF